MKVTFKGTATEVKNDMLIFLGITLAAQQPQPAVQDAQILGIRAEETNTVKIEEAVKTARTPRGANKVKEEKNPVVPTEEKNPVVPTEEKNPVVTEEKTFADLSEFRGAIIALNRNKEAFKEVLANYGLTRLPDALPTQWAAIYSETEAIPA
jgi:hypothetical protein